MQTQTYLSPFQKGPATGEEVLRSVQAQARYVLRATEFAEKLGKPAGSVAVASALKRLAKSGHITLATKRPAAWLIVPPEHEHYGAPPVEWWLDDLLRPVEPHYYLCLLSAARHWGSAHYALQRSQVMLSTQHSPLKVGKLQVDFFFKRHLAETPVVTVSTAVARLNVSTREATVLDLIRHQSEVGGIEAVARIAKDLAPAMERPDLGDALDALGQVAAAQRLGFLFERLNFSRLATTVEKWLHIQQRRLVLRPLAPAEPNETTPRIEIPRWAISLTSRQDNIIREVA